MPARKPLASLAAALLCLALVASGPAALAAGVKSTTYYNVHYESWESMANAMLPYLDAAFTSARDVLGYDNDGYAKIDLYFTSDASNWADGYYYTGGNAVYLNLARYTTVNEANAKTLDSLVAHETSHLLFYHRTGYTTLSPWYDEALAYYVGNVVYPHGAQFTKSEIGASLSYYSRGGSTEYSWFDTGLRYYLGSAGSLEWWQLNAIGYYLNEAGTWQGIQNTLAFLASGKSLEWSLTAVYGKPSGQYGTIAGAGVNTLYSDYYHYYFGHY